MLGSDLKSTEQVKEHKTQAGKAVSLTLCCSGHKAGVHQVEHE